MQFLTRLLFIILFSQKREGILQEVIFLSFYFILSNNSEKMAISLEVTLHHFTSYLAIKEWKRGDSSQGYFSSFYLISSHKRVKKNSIPDEVTFHHFTSYLAIKEMQYFTRFLFYHFISYLAIKEWKRAISLEVTFHHFTSHLAIKEWKRGDSPRGYFSSFHFILSLKWVGKNQFPHELTFYDFNSYLAIKEWGEN